MKEVLKDWNLQVNEIKTEVNTFYLSKQSDKDTNGQLLADNKPWRSNKSLGSLLCTEKDIQRRRILAEIAFKKFKKGGPKKLSKRIEHQQLKMFGHILRSMENTPAQTALSFAIESDNLFN